MRFTPAGVAERGEPFGHRGGPRRRGCRPRDLGPLGDHCGAWSRSPATPACGSRRRASTSACRAATRASPSPSPRSCRARCPKSSIPDLADFQPSPGARQDESRFAARIALEEEAKPGASPRAINSRGDQAVDVAGSYRLTRNLDVTAGVRYSQERDRLAPLADRRSRTARRSTSAPSSASEPVCCRRLE